MTFDALIPWLLAAALLIAAAGAVRRVLLWRRGQPAARPVHLLRGLIAAPRRYFVDLHHVVARDRVATRMHVATAGGFVASLVLILLVHGLGLSGPVLGGLLIAALLLMLAGVGLEMMRRFGGPLPARLSRGPWMRLPVSLLVFSVTFLAATLPAAGILPEGTWSGVLVVVLGLLVAWGLAEMLVGMTWGGPMKHAFAGILHLAFHPRVERFHDQGGGRISSDLRPVNLNLPKLGVETPSDFAWNRLLGFDACVQCGRCESVCPAHAAGQPLNPKKLIQDMVVGIEGGTDAGYAGTPCTGARPIGTSHGGPGEAIVPDLVHPDTLWSCTTCRACVYECPMMIEHVDAVVDLRRFLTLEKGETPGKGAEVLDDLRLTDNPGGHDPSGRADWCVDLNLPRMAEVKRAEVLFWVGDAAFDLRSQRTLRAFVQLLRAARVDFAILGTEEADSGDVARRLGDEATFQGLARRNVATLAGYSFDRIVTCDPHALHVLGNEYPAFGGSYEVLHHTQYLDRLIAEGRLTLDKPVGESVTYHDPCYLGRYNGEVEAPRRLLEALGVDYREMERSRFKSRCCGGGGGAPVTDIPGERRIPDMRMGDVRETGAAVVAVACPQCCAMLEGVVQPRAEVRDIAELLLEGVVR